MSTQVEYDPELFALERASVSAALGSLVLGVSKLGATTTSWAPVSMAAFSYTHEYTPDDNGTLIFDSETATVTISYWQAPASAPLYPADRVRATYDGATIFLGTVDTTRFVYATDPDAARHGATHRIDFTASLVGTYAAALMREVCWTYLPAEPAIDRIRRWVTVNGWD